MDEETLRKILTMDLQDLVELEQRVRRDLQFIRGLILLAEQPASGFETQSPEALWRRNLQ